MRVVRAPKWKLLFRFEVVQGTPNLLNKEPDIEIVIPKRRFVESLHIGIPKGITP
jgi:hypothetical protein